MSELLRDSIWTFVGALLAMVAIVVSIFIYVRQKPRKRLRVERVTGVPLVRGSSQGIDGLQVSFKGKPLTGASIVIAEISNSGNHPIQSNDFETPICLVFEQQTELLAASVLETQPAGIPAFAEIKGSSAILAPLLLNPNDTVVLRILLAEGVSEFKPFARIAGVSTIESRLSVSLWPPIVGLFSVAIGVVALITSPLPRSNGVSEIRAEEVPHLIAVVFATMLMLGVITRDFVVRVIRIRDKISLRV